MGTRSLTYFYQDGEPFVAFYRQMDGYPEGHGVELGEILAPLKIVNGYQIGMGAGEYANGPGCLAAQVVQRLKEDAGIGGIYMINPDPGKHTEGWQEYEYHVHADTIGSGWDAKFQTSIEVRNPSGVIFTGSFEDFLKWARKPPRNKEGEYKVVKPKVAKTPQRPTYDTLRDALQHEWVRVTFTKADGSERVMNCSTNMDLIPEEFHPTGTSKVADTRHDPKLYKVFDLEKQDWRSFREERIINWQVA